MDYQKVYNDLISHRKSNPLEKSKELYTELHHIIPRCLGGLDDKENLVRLSGREHFIAHRLLAKIYPAVIDLRFAAMKMARKRGSSFINSRLFEMYRAEHAEFVSKMMSRREVSPSTRAKISKFMKGRFVGEKNGFYGRVHTQETKDKISQLNSGRESPNPSGVPRSEKDRLAIQRGVRRGDEHPMKDPEVARRHSEKMKGKRFAEEHKKKIGEANSSTWVLTNPEGVMFEHKGSLDKFCDARKLSVKMLHNSKDAGGKKCVMSSMCKSERSVNTVGWSCVKKCVSSDVHPTNITLPDHRGLGYSLDFLK